MQISQEYRLLDDGPTDYNVTTLRGMPQTPRNQMPHIVIANGWTADTTMYRRLALRMIDAADGNLAITTYDDPNVGSSAYGLSYKAERLARSVRAVGWDRPVTLLGHSRGWLTTAEVGDQLVGEEFVGKLAGLTPMGHGEMKDFDLRRALANLGTEVVRSPQTFATMGSVATTARLSLRGLAHLATNPAEGYREIRDIMCTDTTEQTAKLSRMAPTLMITGEHDVVVPPDCLQRRLEAADYQGALAVVNTTHVGAVIDYNHTPEVYEAMQEHGVL